MSKVHEALRRAEQAGYIPSAVQPPPSGGRVPSGFPGMASAGPTMQEILAKVQEVPYRPLADAHLLDPARPSAAPNEEFRSLRTRLNHLQSLSPIHNIVVTSPSPAEGKSFTAVNLVSCLG